LDHLNLIMVHYFLIHFLISTQGSLDNNHHQSTSLMVILDRNEKAARDAFNTSIDGGLTFIDTAEVYGSGVSTYLILSKFH
jgi:predicted aldo/keto reductase-like oxidoreductase